MFEEYQAMSKSNRKVIQYMTLAALEFVLDTGVDEACKAVMAENPDLTLFPSVSAKAKELGLIKEEERDGRA